MIHQLTYLAVGPTVAVRALAVLVEITLRVPATSAIIQTGHVTYTRGLTETVAAKQGTGECWVHDHSTCTAISIAWPMYLVAAYSATVRKKQLLTGVFAATWAIERIWTDTGSIIARSSIVADKSVAQFLSCTHSEEEGMQASFISADRRSHFQSWTAHGLQVVHVIVHTHAYPLQIHMNTGESYSTTSLWQWVSWRMISEMLPSICIRIYKTIRIDRVQSYVHLLYCNQSEISAALRPSLSNQWTIAQVGAYTCSK